MVFEWLDLASFVLMLLPNKGLNESKIIKDAQGKSAAPYNPARKSTKISKHEIFKCLNKFQLISLCVLDMGCDLGYQYMVLG